MPLLEELQVLADADETRERFAVKAWFWFNSNPVIASAIGIKIRVRQVIHARKLMEAIFGPEPK